jgi:hypothetical protein
MRDQIFGHVKEGINYELVYYKFVLLHSRIICLNFPSLSTVSGGGGGGGGGLYGGA